MKGPPNENVHRDREADGEARNLVERALGVDGRGEDDEDEEERHHGFERDAVRAGEVAAEVRCDRAERLGCPGGVGKRELNQVGCRGGAKQSARSSRRWLCSVLSRRVTQKPIVIAGLK